MSAPGTTTPTRGRRSTPAARRGPTINITPPERAARVAIGLVTAISGVVLITGAGSAVAVVLEVLLVLAGLDLVVTGARGYCPLYDRLGYTPPSLRRTR